MCTKLISRFCGYISVCSAGLACTHLCSCIQLVAVLDWNVHRGLTCRPVLPLEWLEQLQCFGSLPHGLSSSRASLSSRIVWTSLNSNWFFKRENRSYSYESSWGLRLELPTHHQSVTSLILSVRISPRASLESVWKGYMMMWTQEGRIHWGHFVTIYHSFITSFPAFPCPS